MAKLEIACFSPRAALIAQEYGADRVEFCADRAVGGITPALADVKKLCQLLHIPLHIMIRPRGGGFVYTDAEFEQMRRDVLAVKALEVDGVVFGVLNANKTVDVVRNRELVVLAAPMSCTFHRAFDEVRDMEKALEDIIACGFQTVLTSGCETNVSAGLSNLKTLVELAQNRIVIMPGGGLRSTNVSIVLRETVARYFHSSAITDGGDTAVGPEVRALKKRIIS